MGLLSHVAIVALEVASGNHPPNPVTHILSYLPAFRKEMNEEKKRDNLRGEEKIELSKRKHVLITTARPLT